MSNKKFRYLIQKYFKDINKQDVLVIKGGFFQSLGNILFDCFLLILSIAKYIFLFLSFTFVRTFVVLPYFVGAVIARYLVFYPVKYIFFKLLVLFKNLFLSLFQLKKLIFYAPISYLFFFVFPKNKDLKFKEIYWYNNINRTNSLEKDFLKYNSSFSAFRHLKHFKPKKFLLSEDVFFRYVNAHRVGVHNQTPHFISHEYNDVFKGDSFVKDVYSFYQNKNSGNSYFFDWFVKKNGASFLKTSSEIAFESSYGNPFKFSTKWYNNKASPSKFKNLDSYIESKTGDYADQAYSAGRFMHKKRGYKVLPPDISSGFLNIKNIFSNQNNFRLWRNDYKSLPYYNEGKLQEYRKLLYFLWKKRLFFYRSIMFETNIKKRNFRYAYYVWWVEKNFFSNFNLVFNKIFRKQTSSKNVLRRNPIIHYNTWNLFQPPVIPVLTPRFWRVSINDWLGNLHKDLGLLPWLVYRGGKKYYRKRYPYLNKSTVALSGYKNYNMYLFTFVETLKEMYRVGASQFTLARFLYLVVYGKVLSPSLNMERYHLSKFFFNKYIPQRIWVPSNFFSFKNRDIASFFGENFFESYQNFYKKKYTSERFKTTFQPLKRFYIYEQPFIVNWNNFNQFKNYSNISSNLQVRKEDVLKWESNNHQQLFRYSLFGSESIFNSLANLSNNTLYLKYDENFDELTKEKYKRAFRNFFKERSFQNKSSRRSRQTLNLSYIELRKFSFWKKKFLGYNHSYLSDGVNLKNHKLSPFVNEHHHKKIHSDLSRTFLGNQPIFGYEPGLSTLEMPLFNLYATNISVHYIDEVKDVEDLLETTGQKDGGSAVYYEEGIHKDSLFFLTKSAMSDFINLIKNINFYNNSYEIKQDRLDNAKRKIKRGRRLKARNKNFNPSNPNLWEKTVFLRSLYPVNRKKKMKKIRRIDPPDDFIPLFITRNNKVVNHKPNWSLSPGLDHMYLVWKNRKLSPVIYSPVRKRMKVADYWVLRRAFYKGFLSTSDIYRYLKTSYFLKKLRDVENKILNFIFNIMPSDFILVEAKYVLLHCLLSFSFLDSFLIEMSNFFSTDLMFLKNFFIRLILCFSDQWLWFTFAYVKVSSSVFVNMVFDDIAGGFMFYSKSFELYSTEAYVPIRRKSYRRARRRYFKKQLFGRSKRLFSYKYGLLELQRKAKPSPDEFFTNRVRQFRRKFSLQNSYFLRYNLLNRWAQKIKNFSFDTNSKKWHIKKNEQLINVSYRKINDLFFKKLKGILNHNVYLPREKKNKEMYDYRVKKLRKLMGRKYFHDDFARKKRLKNKKIFNFSNFIRKVENLSVEDFMPKTSKDKKRYKYYKFSSERYNYHKIFVHSYHYKDRRKWKRIRKAKLYRYFRPLEHLKLKRSTGFQSYSWRRLVIYHFSGRHRKPRKRYAPRNPFRFFSKYRRNKFIHNRIHILKTFPARLQYSFLGLMRYNNDFCTNLSFRNPLYLIDTKITTNLFSYHDVNSLPEISNRFFKFYNDSLRRRNFPIKFKYFYLFQYHRFLKSGEKGAEYLLHVNKYNINDWNRYERKQSYRLKRSTDYSSLLDSSLVPGNIRLPVKFDYEEGDKFIVPSFKEDSTTAKSKPKFSKKGYSIARHRRRKYVKFKTLKKVDLIYKKRKRVRTYKLLKVKQKIHLFLLFSIIYPIKQLFLLPFFLIRNYFFTSIFLYFLISFCIILLLSLRVAFNDLKEQLSNQYLWSSQHSLNKFNFKAHFYRFVQVFLKNIHFMVDIRNSFWKAVELTSKMLNEFFLELKIHLASWKLNFFLNLRRNLTFVFYPKNCLIVIIFWIKKIMKKCLQLIIFFIVFTLIVSILKNYLILTGKYITHLPSMLIILLFFMLFVWFLSICSNKFVDNFLTSPYQAEQFLQENSGFYELDVEEEDVYHLEESQLEEEQESFDEFPFFYHEDLLLNNEFDSVGRNKVLLNNDDYVGIHTEETYTWRHYQVDIEDVNQDMVSEFEEEESLKMLLFTAQLFSPRRRSRRRRLYKYDEDWWLDEESDEKHNAHFFYYYFGRSGAAEKYNSHIIDVVSDFASTDEEFEEEEEWDIIGIDYFDEESEDDSDLFDYVEFSEENSTARLYHDRYFENVTLFDPSSTKVQPSHFYEFFADQEYGDSYIINNLGWVNELFFDRFLIDLNKDDIYMFHDQEIISKICTYGSEFLDGNSLESSDFRLLSFSILKQFKPSSIFSHNYFTADLMGLVRNDSVFKNKVDDFDNFNILNASWKVQFLLTNSSLLINFNPYKFNVGNKLNLRSVSILGYEMFNNKYKRKFFKNPQYYIELLSLKNYPELTYLEAERLWAYLGCTEKEWNSLEKSTKEKIIMPYDNYDTPFAVCALVLGVYYNKLNMLGPDSRLRFRDYIENDIINFFYPYIKRQNEKRVDKGLMYTHPEHKYEYNPMLFFFDTVSLFVNFMNDNLFFKGRIIINNYFLSPQTVDLIHSIFKKLCFSFFLYTGFFIDFSYILNLNFNCLFFIENNSYLILLYFYCAFISLINDIFSLFLSFFEYVIVCFFFDLSNFYLAQTFFLLLFLLFIKLIIVILYFII